MSFSCVLIGAGNLAWHLGVGLQKEGIRISQVFSRTNTSASSLATKLNTVYATKPEEVFNDCDFFIVALKDDAVAAILPRINFQNKLLIHCSGSLPLDILLPYSENTGVLYPLQTFSKQRAVNLKDIPVFIEANSTDNLNLVKNIALKLSGNVWVAGSEERRWLHISAVFACNFVNHCYSLADETVKKSGFSFDVLKPLIQETADKIKYISPKEAQTGPAVRFDKKIIEKHIGVLSDNPDLAQLYQNLSESIFKFQNKKE